MKMGPFQEAPHFQRWIATWTTLEIRGPKKVLRSVLQKYTVIRCTEEAMHARQKVRGECDKETNIKVGSI